MFTENLGVFFADFGKPCTYAGYPFLGMANAPDETLNMGSVNVLSTMYMLEVMATDVVAAGIVSGAAITVDASLFPFAGTTTFVVRDVLSIDDGAVNHLTLSK